MSTPSCHGLPITLLGIALVACQEPGSGEGPPPSTAPTAASAAAPISSAAPPERAPSAPSALVAPAVPEAIQVPQGVRPVLAAHARGVQIYTCGPKKDAPQELEWSLKAPEAELLDAGGKSIGKHFAGPSWQASDGSKVVGAMKAKADAPGAAAIPWLLVEVKSSEGQGALAHVTYVQRVNTEGGKAPTGGCDPAHLQAQTRVDYQADYFFYAP